jgi:tripartite-type tricarboxylate transporter receptor subunit TctC
MNEPIAPSRPKQVDQGLTRRYRRQTVNSLLGAAGALAFASACADELASYPSKPLRIILSTPAGGSLDTVGRLIGERLTADWKQPVIVESRAGAAGMLAATAVAKAAPDGYTILLSLASVVQNTVLRTNTPYQLRDLAPVSMAAAMPVVIVVKVSNPVNSLADLLKVAKDPQGKVTYASWGIGSTGHMIGEALVQESGAQMSHVPYKGEAEPLSDLLGSRVTAAMGSPGFYGAHTATVKILAVGAEKRLKDFPNVPTFAEAGYPAANLSGWGGFFVPVATPTAIVAKLSSEIQKIVAQPEVASRIRQLQYEPVGNSSEDFSKYLTQEVGKWTAVAKKGNLQLD